MIGPRRSILLLLVRERMEEDPGVHFQAWSWEESVPETVRSIYERPRAVFASTDYSSNRASTRRSSSEVTLARSYVPGDYLEQTHGTRREGGRERRKVGSPCSFPSVRYSVLLLFVLVETIRRRWPNIEYRKLSREASEKLPQLTVVFSQRCNYGERRIEWGIDGGKICRCARSND